jgi:probable H4MPT-linked C1 transfer pathway protein
MNWLGLDIGGANLKAANGRGWARGVPFPLWREPNQLPSALKALIDASPGCDALAITMTGELCDCFRTKVEGVQHILDAVECVAGARLVSVYLVDGRLATIHDARQMPALAAASNWRVLAQFTGRFVPEAAALLIDVGSTTADIVPIIGGRPCPRGFNDTDRLLAGELVYSGVLRTPICAVITWLPWRGHRCPVAAELFATTADAYVVLGELLDQPEFSWTADGRPLTKEFAQDRLARMICADRTSFTADDARIAATRVREAQVAQLRDAVRKVAVHMPSHPERIVTSGAGEFLASQVGRDIWPDVTSMTLSGQIGVEASQCGPAHALAVLAGENFPTFGPKSG